MSERTRLTLEEARARIADIESEEAARDAEYEYRQREAAIERHYIKASPSQLLQMWERGVNEHDQPLSTFEFQALCAARFFKFGHLPPEIEGAIAASTIHFPEPASLPDDNVMLSPREVAEATGVSTYHR